MDRLPDALLMIFRLGGIRIVDLIVRNLAMSSAMEFLHARNGMIDYQNGSQRIKERCISLLQILGTNEVIEKIEELQNSIEGNGNYIEFLERSKFSSEQINAISETIMLVAEK